MDRLTYSGTHEAKHNVTIQDVCNKLGKYEDMEEQGRLMIFPCKPGDTVYVPSGINNYIYPVVIREVIVTQKNTFFIQGEFLNMFGDVEEEFEFEPEELGKIFYLTDKEALKALEGMKK